MPWAGTAPFTPLAALPLFSLTTAQQLWTYLCGSHEPGWCQPQGPYTACICPLQKCIHQGVFSNTIPFIYVCACVALHVCVCVCVHPYVPQFMYRGQRMTVLSTMRIKLSSFGSTTSTLSSRPSHRHSSGLSVYLSTALTSPPLWKLCKCMTVIVSLSWC